jgi:hypothetical protein
MQAEGKTSSAEATSYMFSVQSHEGEAKKSFHVCEVIRTDRREKTSLLLL